MNNKKANVSLLPRRMDFSLRSSPRKEPAARRYRRGSSVTCDKYRLTHVTADTGERYLVYFTSATRDDIFARIRAIFTPAACATSFAFYRAATRYFEYTLGGCLVIPRCCTSCVLLLGVYMCKNGRTFTCVSSYIGMHEIIRKFHQSLAIKWKIKIYSNAFYIIINPSDPRKPFLF